MRVSAAFVGVNVAATLSVAVQPQAIAGGCNSSTADFLKASIANVAVKPAPRKTVKKKSRLAKQGRKVSMSDPRSVSTRVALGTGSVKLRPFVPNRKLPSKHELVAQKAQMAQSPVESASQPLSGTVSEYAPFYSSNEGYTNLTPKAKRVVKTQHKRSVSKQYKKAAKVASTYSSKPAPRAVPNHSPAVPGKVGHPCHSNSVPSLHSVAHVPAHGTGHTIVQPVHQQPDLPKLPPLHPPNLTPAQQQQMNQMIQLSCVNAGVGQQAPKPQGDLYKRIGPPPFPLNLIPEPAMKKFMRGARDRKTLATKPQYFGSWHQGQQVGGGHHAGSLPRAGFRSYSHSMTGGFGHYAHAPKHSHAPAVAHKLAHAPKPVRASHPQKTSQKTHKQVSMAHTPTYIYPPYRSDLQLGR